MSGLSVGESGSEASSSLGPSGLGDGFDAGLVAGNAEPSGEDWASERTDKAFVDDAGSLPVKGSGVSFPDSAGLGLVGEFGGGSAPEDCAAEGLLPADVTALSEDGWSSLGLDCCALSLAGWVAEAAGGSFSLMTCDVPSALSDGLGLGAG